MDRGGDFWARQAYARQARQSESPQFVELDLTSKI